MRFVVTGSLGNISKPLTQELLQNGHSVTVVSSSEARREAIETLGAQAAIGTVEDVAFLSSTFAGADAVYCMLPPPASGRLDSICTPLSRQLPGTIRKL